MRFQGRLDMRFDLIAAPRSMLATQFHFRGAGDAIRLIDASQARRLQSASQPPCPGRELATFDLFG